MDLLRSDPSFVGTPSFSAMRQVTNDERITAATTLPLVPASADLALDVCSALVLAWQVTQPDVRVPTIYVISADDVGN